MSERLDAVEQSTQQDPEITELASLRNSQKAIVTTARKMLISIYHMLD